MKTNEKREYCNHPHTFAAGAPCGLAALRGRGGGGHRFAPAGLKQNHQTPPTQNMVTKKNQSLLTIGPMIAISRFEEAITPLSESSCSPEITNCAATRNRMAVVMRKNFCKLMRTLLDEHQRQRQWRPARREVVPRKLISSVEFSDTAERISTVSALPSAP